MTLRCRIEKWCVLCAHQRIIVFLLPLRPTLLRGGNQATTAHIKAQPLTREELKKIQDGCLEHCEYYSQEEKHRPLTEKEKLARQDCLAEYQAIRKEIAALDLQEWQTSRDLRQWELVEEKQTEDDWVVV